MPHRHAHPERLLHLPRVELRLTKLRGDGLILDVGGGGEGVIGRLNGAQVVSVDTSAEELREAPGGPLKLVMDARELRFLWEEYGCNVGFREDVLANVFMVSAQALQVRIREGGLKSR